MSESQCTEVDVQFVLTKKRSSANLPQEDPPKTTKTIGLRIPDFLEKLNDGKKLNWDDFITAPKFRMADPGGCVGLYIYQDITGHLYIRAESPREYDKLKSIGVTGICGNLALEKNDVVIHDDYVCVELGSKEELKEAMTSSGNHKLDLQVTLTAVENKADESKWIIPR